MSSRKKIAISITAISLIVIAAVVTVVAVWAARTTSFGGSFSGSYTAQHVDATITGAYKIGATVDDPEGWTNLTTDDGETITFTSDTATGSGEASASFNLVNNIVLKSTDNVIFKYTITNNSETSTAFTVVGTKTGTFTNLSVSYKYKVDDGAAQDLTAEGDTTNSITVNAGSTTTLFVIIEITNVDTNATLDGSVNWTLTAIEE